MAHHAASAARRAGDDVRGGFRPASPARVAYLVLREGDALLSAGGHLRQGLADAGDQRLLERAHIINIKDGRSYRSEGPDAPPDQDRPPELQGPVTP